MILLASYPKSGNTWMRALLGQYFAPQQPLNINALQGQPILSLRARFDDMMGVSSADIPAQTVESLRADFCRETVKTLPPNSFVKIHDAYNTHPKIFPKDAVRAVIYLVRHPANIALSYAKHQAWPVDRIVQRLINPDQCLYDQNEFSFAQLRQHMGTWAQHVTSWVNQTDIPLTVIRYEDLCANPDATLATALGAFGVKPDPQLIRRSVESCSLKAMQEQEKTQGFNGKNARTLRFFDQGPARNWQQGLTVTQIQTLNDAFGKVMARFDYSSVIT